MSRIAQQRATTRPEVERSLGRLRKAHPLAEPFVKVRIHTEDGTPFARPTSAPDPPARADCVRQAAIDDTPQEQRVLHYLQKHEQITRKDAAHLCRLSLDQASRLLRRLVKQGKLRARGSGDQRTTRGREHAKGVRTIRKHAHAATVRRPTAQHPPAWSNSQDSCQRSPPGLTHLASSFPEKSHRAETPSARRVSIWLHRPD